jgi:hypothetical protein
VGLVEGGKVKYLQFIMLLPRDVEIDLNFEMKEPKGERRIMPARRNREQR